MEQETKKITLEDFRATAKQIFPLIEQIKAISKELYGDDQYVHICFNTDGYMSYEPHDSEFQATIRNDGKGIIRRDYAFECDSENVEPLDGPEEAETQKEGGDAE